MKKNLLLSLAILLFYANVYAQVGINTDNSAPDPSAGLDVKFSNKGFLPPRMTLPEISLILYPASGLMVFCTTNSKIYVFDGISGQWKELDWGATFIIPAHCGKPVSVDHVAGSVAPVTKTVIYGTVANIPGEPNKCWITSNLGADHQATAVDDATEASAGWYWQFNLKQGYKNDGSTLTPGTTWVVHVSENSDWLPVNDPCKAELGNEWRIPTSSEWNNVNNTNGWTEWNGPWNSRLKLHAAGSLGVTGAIFSRGQNGRYWSCSQVDSDFGWHLIFTSEYSNANNSLSKTRAMTMRCIKE